MKSILNILSIILISHPTFSQESSFCSYSTDTTQGVPIATNHPLYIYVKHKVDSIVKSTHREYVGILGIKFTIDSTRSIDSVTRIKFVHPNLDSVFFEALINAESELFNQLKYSKLYAINITLHNKNSRYDGVRILEADCNYKKAVKVLRKLNEDFPESSDIVFRLARSMICSNKENEGFELMKLASEMGDCDAIQYLKSSKRCC